MADPQGKILIWHDDFVKKSTELAEIDHHEHCGYECCGEHNGFQDFEKCPKCGMTEDIQDAHNDEWWQNVDNVEADLLEKYWIIDWQW